MEKQKIKILTIFGTRKEFIRLYPVLEKLKAADDFESIVVTTSQYQEELEDLYDLFDIRPDQDLNLRRSRNSLSDITNLALSGLEPLLKRHQPDLVLVQGESTSAFVGALAAFYNKIPVAHNGAGVRPFKKMEPYPEEVNRRMVSTLSDLHFVFAAKNTEYLIHQGAIPRDIFVTGNTIIDSILSIARKKRNTLCKHIPPDDLNTYKMILVTSHKKEHWGRALKSLCFALIDLTQAYPDIQFGFPLQFNPKLRETVSKILKNQERIHLLDQLPYEAFVEAMSKSHLIITDSDCIREEGLALKKPVLLVGDKDTLPDVGNWIPMDRVKVVVETSKLLEDPEAYQSMIADSNPYGDGHAAERIVRAIHHHFGMAERPKDYKPKAEVQTTVINSGNVAVNANAMQ